MASPTQVREPTERAVREMVAEREAYRARVRRASEAIVFAMAAIIAVSAVLPTTEPAYRSGLVATAALILASGLLWFTFVPQHWFGAWRVFVATVIAQSVLLVLLVQTGGLLSIFFPYYLVPSVALLFGGSVRQVATLAGIAVAGLGVATALVPGGLGSDADRDTAVVRVMELGTVAFVSAVAARTAGETRAALAQRTVHLAEATDAASRASETDDLTQLHNRRFLRGRLEILVSRAQQSGSYFSLVAADLDGLKAINDRLGHATGDLVLALVAGIFRDALRAEDAAVRTGGDEFLLLLADANIDTARAVAARVADAVDALNVGFPVSISAGAAQWVPGTPVGDTLARADAELYRVKRARRARAEADTPRR